MPEGESGGEVGSGRSGGDDSLDTTADAAPAATDRRHLRSSQSREQVTLALLELLREGDLQPTAQRIAERAEVSARTVFRLFSDLEQLFACAARAQQERTANLYELAVAPGALADRVTGLARQRARLFEEIAPVRRAAAVYAPFYAVIRDDDARIDGILRAQVRALFEPEIRAVPPRERWLLVDGLDGIASWRTWEALRYDQKLSLASARDCIERTMSSLLTHSRSEPGP